MNRGAWVIENFFMMRKTIIQHHIDINLRDRNLKPG